MQTHQPLPGIEVGDVGTKIALVSTDNGYLRLSNFRAPKSCHLSKYVEISDDGSVKEKVKNSTKLVYGGMLKLRVYILTSGHHYIGKMATIATRFSFLRR